MKVFRITNGSFINLAYMIWAERMKSGAYMVYLTDGQQVTIDGDQAEHLHTYLAQVSSQPKEAN